jgi:hypothetical protein
VSGHCPALHRTACLPARLPAGLPAHLPACRPAWRAGGRRSRSRSLWSRPTGTPHLPPPTAPAHHPLGAAAATRCLPACLRALPCCNAPQPPNPLPLHHSAEEFFQASLKVQPVLDEAQARAAAAVDSSAAQAAQVGRGCLPARLHTRPAPPAQGSHCTAPAALRQLPGNAPAPPLGAQRAALPGARCCRPLCSRRRS